MSDMYSEWKMGDRGLYRTYLSGPAVGRVAVELTGRSGQANALFAIAYGPTGFANTATIDTSECTRAEVFRVVQRRLMGDEALRFLSASEREKRLQVELRKLHQAGNAPTSATLTVNEWSVYTPDAQWAGADESEGEGEDESESESEDEVPWDGGTAFLHPDGRVTDNNQQDGVSMKSKTVGEMAVETGNEVSSAVWMGTKMAAYGQVLKRGRQYVETKLGDKYPEFLKTEAGRKVVEWLVATVVLTFAIQMPENTPGVGQHKAAIIENARLALAKASENGVEGVLDLFFDEMMPLMMLFASDAMSTATAAPAISAPVRDFVKEAEALNAKEAVPVEAKPVRSARPRRTEVG